ncbi:MAG: formate dehydrogenase accessory sulfurtransferase FdhD [Steroidobacteraceae bacterium]|nr:formate dehydrogenase accessory sulfurtransferase FdhD [Deltaproteobacteria bacterium]
MTTEKPKHSFFSFRDNCLQPVSAGVVSEYPVQLIVNGREIATLIGSPHDLRFLVAGFLRLQGFVSSLSDFEMFSVCEEFGSANVRIKGELPERLKPVLTSGCGAGISFSMPAADSSTPAFAGDGQPVLPAQIFGLMEELARRAEQYRSHGGIHSAAIGRAGRMMLYAEDLGRHNTFDRIAGEALFKGINMAGAELVTSGRVSTEMVAKASLMGIKLIASRTSPTDMAVKLCDQAGICLVGYVRGGSFTVYSHPEVIEPFPSNSKIAGVTGVILAGGSSSRMGRNKALLEIDGDAIITRVYRTLAALFHEVVIVTNTPEEYDFLPCRKVADIYPGAGSIAGLQAGLAASRTERIFVAACDMPFLNPDLIRLLCGADGDNDAVVPLNDEGLQEPLHAVYRHTALNAMRDAIENGDKSILHMLDNLDTRLVPQAEFGSIAGALESFRNVNTMEEYERVTGQR